MFNIPGNQTETLMRYQTGSDDKTCLLFATEWRTETLRPCGWSITWPSACISGRQFSSTYSNVNVHSLWPCKPSLLEFILRIQVLKKDVTGMFPGHPVVIMPGFHCRGHEFHPWSGNHNFICLTVQPLKKKWRRKWIL